ncbi:MAG TPA: phosphoglycerate mutase family protein [Acidobacteriota bacterium]|nr:phosphoglycerate mutase family protein [Acidobacteriota bacterium]HNB73363.1 phosphoglycerate mutase family protein [Acidobacteriota bacterium]HND20693.1 phosphoglycerate mutase family protein [Acidobacteriota bacterium]HNG92529.1 phosphoglycerate mutase family protein [Acidobacteriota bacterium]HNH84223.1 phosphoglycerate mutase family protein [Acidobacteriota bacterium]
MKPRRIILIRHGESEGNADREMYQTTPDCKLNLTDLGREQAREAENTIKSIIGDSSVYAYISPYYRTRQTFEEFESLRNPKNCQIVVMEKADDKYQLLTELARRR